MLPETENRLPLAALLDPAHLADMIEQGYVRRQVHPTLPLAIFNYTERAQYERVWNPVTLQCRGLIVAEHDDSIVARCLSKFFNYAEHPAGSLDLGAPAEITDKLDGSLGILYPAADQPTGWAIATRGSFTSEQAQHATALLADRYPDFEPPNGMTVLFEIIYPGNRIVVDYGDTDDLFLLGAVDIATGQSVGPDWVSLWDGPAAETFAARTLADALALPPRRNAEGVVVRMINTDMRVKLKQDDYVALHKLITGMNARAVWERLGAGDSIAQICAGLPDEFWPWVEQVGRELIYRKDAIIGAARETHRDIIDGLPDGWTRKDYALAAAKSPLRPWLFNLLDGRDPSAGIWRTLKPSGERALVTYSEDTA